MYENVFSLHFLLYENIFFLSILFRDFFLVFERGLL
nr:MAG TPA: hypothetical protein [Caudoviricetes sp.]DAU79468.1 MAG TPA: hypothetical protein [Caudoviricetes sp.]